MILLRTICLIAGLTVLSACGNQDSTQESASTTGAKDVKAEEVKEEFRKAAKTVKEFTEDQMIHYQDSLKAQIKELDKRHEQLEAQIHEVGGKAQDEMKATLAELESKKTAAKSKLDTLANKTGKAWEEMGTGLEEAIQELEEGYDQARKEFSS